MKGQDEGRDDAEVTLNVRNDGGSSGTESEQEGRTLFISASTAKNEKDETPRRVNSE